MTFLFAPYSVLLQAIANACKVPATSIPGLSESDVSDESEKQFNEDQELEQLINGQICYKIYPFGSGMIFTFELKQY